MNLNLITPRKALNKAFLKVKPNRTDIEKFKDNLKKVLEQIKDGESEEFHKNLIIEFLKNTYYSPNHFVNTKGRNDLVVHNGKDAKSTVGVLIEAKKPANKSEMLKADNINAKAFQELVLYYLRERITTKNLEIKNIVATNIYEWFIFDAHIFEKLFSQDKKLVKQFEDFEEGRLGGKDTSFFYKEVAEPFIETVKKEISFTYFDLRDYEKTLLNNDKQDDTKLIALYKLLSPEHLLKLPFANDSNSLDKAFYAELLHIIGLTETKDGGKKLIQQKKEGERDGASLLENAISQLDSHDKISRLEKASQFGETNKERLFAVGLELVITWINRILFLKLLEAQLVTYHKGDKEFNFLSLDKIKNYDDLDGLFFRILARKTNERDGELGKIFSKVPYLNSSLFEPTDIEHQTIFISNLQDDKKLPLLANSKLKNSAKFKNIKELNAIEYLFEFLNAYDFSSEGSEEIQEENKTLINASVLGLIFEKINGYKDGSFFTPGFITMYMCRETIRRAIVQKFNEKKKWDLKEYKELYDKIEDRKEANEIINSIKICDPAVGSGHFLVSALNEIIAIKADLKILSDREGKRLKEYQVEVINDDLVVTDEEDQLFDYNPKNKESQRIQETLFHEKQTIIERCLFGVDINPNSVKICRLRLWIELLKSAYYKADSKFTELETLPNIDINIKCGNSLISRFALDADLKQALKKSKWNVETYRNAVNTYHNAQSKEEKREMEKLINDIKGDFRTEISKSDPKLTKLNKLKGELITLTTQTAIFGMSDKEKKKFEKDVETKTTEIEKIETEVEEIKSNKIYENAFEWRFEFPEVLNDEGDFVGFDVVIGNPPYIRHEEIKHLKPQLEKDFKVYNSSADILTYFFELSNNIIKSKGILSFIVSNKFFKATYGEQLRSYLSQNTLLHQIIEFDKFNVFEEATVKAAIIQFSKEQSAQKFAYVDVIKKPDDLAILINEEGVEYEQSLFANGQWIFQSEKNWKIYHKINEYGTPLSDWDLKINFGIKTGFNEAFLIDEETKKRLIKEDKNAAKIIKPLFRGREIEKYTAKFQNTYLIFIPKGYTIKSNLPKDNLNYIAEPSPRYGNMGFDEAWAWLKNNYPSTTKYLSQFKDSAEKRQDQGDYWWELRACDYYNEFEKPKIIWKRIGSKLRFCYDESGTYTLDSTCIATGKNLKYLVGVLNSKLIENELNRYAPKTGTGDLIISVQALSPLQIPLPTEKQEKQMNELVDKTILKKQQNQDIGALEKEIDHLVYKLYELTEEEIRIVEGN